jgi:hypothetical protein
MFDRVIMSDLPYKIESFQAVEIYFVGGVLDGTEI